MTPVLLVALILGGILLWGLLLWLVARTVFSVLSGWTRLAERYRAPHSPNVWHWGGQTVKVGGVRYRRCMWVSAQPDGLYLSEAGLLRHAPLRIPWSEMHSPAATSFYGRKAVAVRAGLPPVGTIEFPVELYNAILAATAHR